MQGRKKVNSALRRIRQAAERDRKGRFTSLLHHIYAVDMLREAYFSLKREAAPGVDGETWRHLERTWRNISRSCPNGWPGVRTERVRFSARMYRKPMVGNGR
jgi:hypothetical protein